MSADLPDSNVWVALCMEQHKHHKVALAWFDSVLDENSVRFARMTQNSFLRLVTVKEFQKDETMTNAQAMSAYRAFRADPRCGWLDEPAGLEATWLKLAERNTASPKVWMDAYLAAFAIHAGVRFVTMDGDFEKYQRDGLDVLLLGATKKEGA